jgi:acetyl-CoA synthetase
VSTSVFGDEATADWRPPADRPATRLSAFLGEHGLPSVAEAHRRAVADPEWFWDAVLRHMGVNFFDPYDRVLDTSAAREFPSWFVGGTLNLAHNLLDRPGLPGPDTVALISEAEDGELVAMTRAELRREVAALAGFLRSSGIGRGDRVGLFLPMVVEGAVAYLACASVGAITVPIFSGYGVHGVAARLRQAGCRMLITADGFVRRRRSISLWDAAAAAVAECPLIETVLRVPAPGFSQPAGAGSARVVSWDDATAQDGDLVHERMAADDPVLIMYTSGTTGEPKGVVLTHGGFLTKVVEEFGFVFDFSASDVVLWLGDMGWMVGPLLVTSTLYFGATAVLYGGSLDQPDPGRLWQSVERHGVTVLGVSPTAVRMLRAAGDEWLERSDRSSLRGFISTGEAWNEAPWWWLFETVGARRLPVLNYTGGTETGGGILACYADRPLKATGFYGPVLGMDADVVDEQGRPVRGVPGELVVRNVWPGMTRGLWDDVDGARYLETYWRRFEGVWAHGDLAVIDDSGHWFVLGRSDDTLKVAGKRVGPAEVETAMLDHPAVHSAAAVGIPDEDKGQAVICFAVAPGVDGEAADVLRKELTALVVRRLGRSLAPAAVHLVSELPVTKTGKIMRRLVRARHLGLPVGDTTGLENPAALDALPVTSGTAASERSALPAFTSGSQE